MTMTERARFTCHHKTDLTPTMTVERAEGHYIHKFNQPVCPYCMQDLARDWKSIMRSAMTATIDLGENAHVKGCKALFTGNDADCDLCGRLEALKDGGKE